MDSLLSSVTAGSSVVATSRKRQSSPDWPSSEPALPSSDSDLFGSSKRYEVEEDEPLWGHPKRPRMQDIKPVIDENEPDYAPDFGMHVDEDQVIVKEEPRDEEDEDVDIKVRDRATRPLATSTKVNGGTNTARRKVVKSSSVKVVKPDPVRAEIQSDSSSKLRPQANGKALPPGAVHWSSVQDSLVPQPKVSEFDEVSAPAGLTKAENILEEDGSLRIFWLDFMELDGVVHLVGKVMDRKSGKYVSACVSVNGIQRNLFVKPRPKRVCAWRL